MRTRALISKSACAKSNGWPSPSRLQNSSENTPQSQPLVWRGMSCGHSTSQEAVSQDSWRLSFASSASQILMESMAQGLRPPRLSKCTMRLQHSSGRGNGEAYYDRPTRTTLT
eukprot:GHRQ01023677.1.p1 GENE.GHRQ01023677.1~~GHRQ01023677.1.p1  ORF type:complete len:113 (-),score=9.12 GHRQ01023677.1:187-525(-)